MKLQNRWMGKYKASITKRISGDFEPFRQDAEVLTDYIFTGQLLKIVGYFKVKYNLSLNDATNFTVAFLGVYNNEGPFWTTQRYLEGMKVRERILQ